MLVPFILFFVLVFAYQIYQKTKRTTSNSQVSASLIEVSNGDLFDDEIEEEFADIAPTAPRLPAQKKSVIAKDPPKELSEEERILCILKSLNLNIPLVRDIRIQGRLKEFDSKGPNYRISNFVAWVYSSDCPIDTYSVVQGSKVETGLESPKEKWQTDKVIDCRDTNLGELVMNSGQQGDIKESQNNYEDEYNFAIKGDGSFLLRCEDGGTYMTRKGDFVTSDLGFLMTKSGCYVLNPYQRPIFIGAAKRAEFSTKTNCFTSTWQCLAVVKNTESAIKGYEYADKLHLRVELDPYSYIGISSDSEILEDSLEDLDPHDRAATGIFSWDNIKEVQMPANCPG